MLGGLFLLSASIAVVAVIIWSIMSDRALPSEPTKGLFAMRDEHLGRETKSKAPSPELAGPTRPSRRRSNRPRRKAHAE